MSMSAYMTLERNAKALFASMAGPREAMTMRFTPSHDGWSSAKVTFDDGGLYMAVDSGKVKVSPWDASGMYGATETHDAGEVFCTADGKGHGDVSRMFLEYAGFVDRLAVMTGDFYYPVDMTAVFHCGMVDASRRCSLVVSLADVCGEAVSRTVRLSPGDLVSDDASRRVVGCIGDMHSRRHGGEG